MRLLAPLLDDNPAVAKLLCQIGIGAESGTQLIVSPD
jgi:hypothetical protein